MTIVGFIGSGSIGRTIARLAVGAGLARPVGAADRSYLPIAGDSAPAKTSFHKSVCRSCVELRLLLIMVVDGETIVCGEVGQRRIVGAG
jgi:3-hydroxyisobutyrate dehydrogenase-like beta-hydroxyacid dehydrogenase